MADTGPQLCMRCKLQPRQARRNSRMCEACFAKAALLRTRLSPDKQEEALRLRGSMPIRVLAQKLGTTPSVLTRLGQRKNLSFSSLRSMFGPDVVQKVVDYEEKHGMQAAEATFSNVNVRTIIKLYGKKSGPIRQKRWTQAQTRQLAQMIGLVTFGAQAAFFNRPNAKEHSIKSFWDNRLGSCPKNLHGMTPWAATRICHRSVVPLNVGGSWRRKSSKARQIILWPDILDALLPGTPEFIRDAIEAMVAFQQWLFGSKDIKKQIINIMNEHEADTTN